MAAGARERRGPGAPARARRLPRALLPRPAGDADRELWRAADAFFGLPDARKRANSLPEHDGYHAIGEEYSDRPDRPDLAESFWARLLHADATAASPTRRAGHASGGAGRLGGASKRCWRELTEALSRHYAERWSPELTFRCDRASHLQLNRYQPCRHERELLTDAHEDGLYLTLLFADAPGLEVQTPARRLAARPAPAGRADRHAGRDHLAADAATECSRSITGCAIIPRSVGAMR